MNSNSNLLSEVAVVLRNWQEDKRWLFDEYSVVAEFIRFCAAVKRRSLRRRAAASLGMTTKNLKRKRLSGCESSTNNGDGHEGFLLRKEQKIVDPIRGG